jgi:hypothetical protein
MVGNSSSPVVISAVGSTTLNQIQLAIKNLTVHGRVELVQILAGYSFASPTNVAAVNPDAQIGPTWIGGDWIASTIAAGVSSGGDGFGNANDERIPIGVDNPNIVSKIASITIVGQAMGTPNSTNPSDHFGFVAQHIDSLRIGATSILLTPGPVNDLQGVAIGITGDLRIREVLL